MYNQFQADRFKNALAERGISQAFIAKKLNVSRNGVNQWANGTKKPKKENLEKIARILDVSPDYLTGKTDFPDLKTEYDYRMSQIDQWEERLHWCQLLIETQIIKKSLGIFHDYSLWENKDSHTVVWRNYESTTVDNTAGYKCIASLYENIKTEKAGNISVETYESAPDLLPYYLIKPNDLQHLTTEIIDYIATRLKRISEQNMKELDANTLYGKEITALLEKLENEPSADKAARFHY